MYNTNILTISIAAALVLTGCERSTSELNAPSSPSASSSSEATAAMEPILLHARVDFTNKSTTQKIGESALSMSLNIQQPAFRSGKGSEATYQVDDTLREQVQGFVHGTGHAQIELEDGRLRETYDKLFAVSTLKTPEKGVFSIGIPEPSSIGDGLSVRIGIHAAVLGTASAKVIKRGAATDIPPTMAAPLGCRDQSEHIADRSDGCGIELRLDASPVAAKDEAGEIMLPKIQEALKQPNAEWVLALLGQTYGAQTTYRDNGHFVLHFTRNYSFSKDGAEGTQDMDITVWSTRRGDAWSPDGVTAVKASR